MPASIQQAYSALNALRQQRPAEAQARLSVLIVTLDQVAIDRASWTLAAEAASRAAAAHEQLPRARSRQQPSLLPDPRPSMGGRGLAPPSRPSRLPGEAHKLNRDSASPTAAADDGEEARPPKPKPRPKPKSRAVKEE